MSRASGPAVQDLRLENLEKRVEKHDELIEKMGDGLASLHVQQAALYETQAVTNQILTEGFKFMKIGLATIASIYGIDGLM
tara:strand:+ start:2370 stop:2612 length:243 start_codon:yes stop_codon:yes gene_type:complete